MTLDELRGRFWWLGLGTSDKKSYIVALEGDTAIVKVVQCTWNRRTQKYEEALARGFAELGLKVKWRPFWSGKLEEEIGKAREVEEKAGRIFDQGAYIDRQREAEIRRATRG